MNMLCMDQKIESPRGSAIHDLRKVNGNYDMLWELTSMSCIPLAIRIFNFAVFVLAFEACVSTARMDCGVRSSKLPDMLYKSWCATRHLGHGWLADAARQPQKYAASSASCDSIRMPG